MEECEHRHRTDAEVSGDSGSIASVFVVASYCPDCKRWLFWDISEAYGGFLVASSEPEIHTRYGRAICQLQQ